MPVDETKEVPEQPRIGPSPSKFGAFFSAHRTQVIGVGIGAAALIVAFLTWRSMSGGATGQPTTPGPGASNSGSVPDTSSLTPDAIDTLTSTLAQINAGQQQIISELSPPASGTPPNPHPPPGQPPPSPPPGRLGGCPPGTHYFGPPPGSGMMFASMCIPDAGQTTLHFPPANGVWGMFATGDHGNPFPPSPPPSASPQPRGTNPILAALAPRPAAIPPTGRIRVGSF